MFSASRFATVSDEKFERILNEKNSINTYRATVAWNTFKSYLIAKNLLTISKYKVFRRKN